MKKSLLLGGVFVLVLISGFVLRSLAQPRESRALGATYAGGVLHTSIPYDAPRSGEGSLVIEILDPEDRVVVSVDRHADANAGQGLWRRDLSVPQGLPVEDLVWHRLRYRFTYVNEEAPALEGIASISRVLRRPNVRVLGQQSYLSGSAAAIRLIVTEPDSSAPITSGSVEIDLMGAGLKGQVLYKGKLNQRGTTRADFHFPPDLVGRYSLHYLLDTALGAAEHVQEIQLEEKSAILLTTEKPIYQPGQTIHFRALALDRSNHQATAGRELTFELEDSKGNKVFRRSTQTDSYGLSSAEFTLADEVNLGTYHLRAALENTAAGTQSQNEIALQVERYVLPRFKVALELNGKETGNKRGYRPGDHVTGVVHSNYFFGKPVDGAEVEVKASGMDVSQFEAGTTRGRTDNDGTFRFDLRLPDYFAGRSMSGTAAQVLVEATVRDTAGHSESRAEPIVVSESPILITVVPEGGTLIPGVENRLYVLTSYADGTPAQTEVRVQNSTKAMQTISTDPSGIAISSLPGDVTNVRVEAKDREGNHASMRVSLEARSGSDQILLRAERAVYRAGDAIYLKVLSTRETGTAYVDVVKDRQTIGTHDIEIVNGNADLRLAATPAMTGTVELHAYVFGPDALPISDQRVVFVQPAEELKIETSLDKPVYKPGDEARIGFRITNDQGQGVQTALGLEIIDQAVFALAEKQPGFAKLFFYLEQEAMKPRYEIHSVTLPEAITWEERSEGNQRDRAAQALFAAAQVVAPNNLFLEFGSALPEDKFREYAGRYGARLWAQIDRTAGIGARDSRSQACDQDLLTARLRDADLRDAWGNRLRVDPRHPGGRTFDIRSAGPDGQFYTADDLVQAREDRYCVEPAQWGNGGTIDLRIEQNDNATIGAAEITGVITDASGAVVPRAEIQVTETANGKIHTLTAGQDGRFDLAELSAGVFDIRISMPGFMTAVRRFSLDEGDRGVLSVILSVGMMAETVTVEAAAPMINTMSAEVSRRRAPKVFAPPSMKDVSAISQPTAQNVHVRSWFPEALYVAPEIITDGLGRASITVPIADNITTWRMAMLASTKRGALGSGTSSLKVFQDFFTELDLPTTLTQGDQVSLPVAVYNYSGSEGRVQLRLAQEDWFSLTGDQPAKTLNVESDHVGGAQFTIQAKRIGKFKLTLSAAMDGPAQRADVVVREIEVVPNGREQSVAFNGRLEKSVEREVTFPTNAIPESGKVFVRLYPGPLSQVVEGMDAILQMPFGCFEQTSSATYPNVLALDYMKRTNKLTPEVHAKAEGLITTGYQRLLTFEVSGGGFSWFGNAPANKILTSYGLMEFSDMSKVHEIDSRVVQRTQQWLASQQQPDGSWRPDSSFINEGATNRYNSDALRITAYIAWALESTGYQGSAIERAGQYISRHWNSGVDAYTLAVLANFATDYQKDHALTRQAIQHLLDSRTEKGDETWWHAEETAVYGRGASAAVETTSLAVQALLKSGEAPAVVRKALNYITSRKDASGTWGTTQATIMALRALLLSTAKSSSQARGTVEITLNGKSVERLVLTSENSDLFHQFVFPVRDFTGSTDVAVHFAGEGGLAYQVVGQYFVPWTSKASIEPLSIDVSYDRTRLAEGDIASATATVKSHLSTTANMVMVDLGIPPGFELMSEDLDDYRTKSAGHKSGGRLEKLTMTATQVVLYFDSIGAGATIKLHYRLRAKYPIHARTFQSQVYEYYDPEVRSVAAPVQMEVRRR